MIEHVLYSLFLVTFGMQIGRILTLYQEANKLARGIDALSKSAWLAPQILAARIDNDQELIEVPHFEPSLTLRCRIIHYGVKAR